VGSNPTRRIERSIAVTRSAEEVDTVMTLAAAGHNHCEIARRTGIPRTTVRGWITGQLPVRRPPHADQGKACRGCELALDMLEPVLYEYAYLLGLYLGDGSISEHARGVFRLRISLDPAYQRIVGECERAMRAVVPGNRVRVDRWPQSGVDEVSAYSKHWPCIFPQHGPGRKHKRAIELTDWQREALDRRPWRFLRGLIHSDGCRHTNTINHPNKTYRYPRYNFTNHSDNIRDLFCEYCDLVGVEWRRMNRWNISVARRESVALMDRYIGPKS
jgi:hypothetical protein